MLSYTKISTYHDTANICQSQLDTQRSSPLPIWCTIARQPGDIASGAEKAGCRDEVGTEVLYACRDIPCEEDSIASDTNWCTDEHDGHSLLVAIGEPCSNAVDEGAPKVDYHLVNNQEPTWKEKISTHQE